jgi:arsenate reductase (thioredoxin)
MKKRVLFVCIGNICRSPMAEAMARKYGSDVLEVASAGLSPAMNTTPYTRSVLAEKNVDLGDHLPRRFRDANLKSFDLIVNLSGSPMPRSLGVPVEDWNVEDPMGKSEEDFRQTREIIEMLVMRLILRARLGKL